LENSTAKTSKRRFPSQLRVRLFLAGALLFALAGAALPPETLANERAALAKAKAQSLLAEERASMLDARAGVAGEEADSARNRAAAIALRIQAAESDMAAAETRIRLIERLRTEQRARLAVVQEPAMRLLAALQMLSRRPPAMALVQPGSTRDLVHTRAALASVIPRLRAQTAGLRAEIERGKALRIDADRARAALSLSRDRLAEKRAEFLQQSAAKRADFDQLRGAALAEEDRAIGLAEQAKDIGALMDVMTEDGALRDRLASLAGPVLRPNEGETVQEAAAIVDPVLPSQIPYRLPATGQLLAGLGDVSDNGVRARGLTLAVRPLAQLIAPSPGRVVFAGPFRGYGNVLIIDHGGGWTSLIASIGTLDVSVGESVIQGSPIGRAGEERPTITVELRLKGEPVDISRLIG
jgi:murein hydrolase activator